MDKYFELANIVDDIEDELRCLQLWQNDRPDTLALQSTKPFCSDTLQFEQWLQWVFIPRLRLLIDNELDLPNQSQIHEYARSCLEQTPAHERFLQLLMELDQLICTQ
ncbi:MAG: YqcC family protein [Gammaproteobacteria bacterium]|nr:YqcC family protein [Gammaproteobacteria bacterium]MDH5727910.1 YqcC family protein [Gammaproteobacteria bacterium]